MADEDQQVMGDQQHPPHNGPPQPQAPQNRPPQAPPPQNRPPQGPAPTPPLYLPRMVRRSAERDRDTPLHTACVMGSYDQALMLLLSGHDPSPTNIWRETPLHYSTSKGLLHLMLLLLDGSALVNATDHQGLTPLHKAIIYGRREACELLLCYGAEIHSRHLDMSTLASEKGVKSARSNMSGGEFKVTDGAGIHGEERVKLPDGAMIGGRERVNVTDRVRNHGEEGVKVSDGAVGNGDDEVSDKVGEEGVKRGVMVEGVDTTRSPLQLASYVHVCHDVVNSALGKVWSLQHLCKITIRRSLGVSRRRRLKELPLPPHLISFLTTLPISCSDELHANWERQRSNKSESSRRRGEARRRGEGVGRGRGIHHVRHHPHTNTL